MIHQFDNLMEFFMHYIKSAVAILQKYETEILPNLSCDL